MADTADLPIALRRTRRSITSQASTSAATSASTAADVAKQATRQSATEAQSTPSKPARTPSRRSQKKHVRFSDPGILQATSTAASDTPISGAGTGLTPMIRRTSLAPVAPRRRSALSGLLFQHGRARAAEPAEITEMTFLPLCQVLDGRVRRRLRRNGLSEEMNTVYADRKRKADQAYAELAQLRADVAAKDAVITRLGGGRCRGHQEPGHEANNHSACRSSDGASLAPETHTGALSPVTPEANRTYNWTLAARDPWDADTSPDTNLDTAFDIDMSSPLFHPGQRHGRGAEEDADAAFGDITIAELQASTPSRKRTQTTSTGFVAGSFPTPPATSPATTSFGATAPCTPTAVQLSPVSITVPPSTACAGVQASLPDFEKDLLRGKLAVLQGDVTRLENVLAKHQALEARLEAQLGSGDDGTTSTSAAEAHAALDTRVVQLVRTLADKTAALAQLSSEVNGLGFGRHHDVCSRESGVGSAENSSHDGRDANSSTNAPSDPSDVVAAVAAAFRTARLELEYLTPGEIVLPLNAVGAEVLDLLLVRLRTLSRAADDQIDEYRELERSLRQQLGARVDAMDNLSETVGARDARIAELETSIERLKGAMANYARDVAELEALVRQVQTERDDKEKQRDAAEKARAAAEQEAAEAQAKTAALAASAEAMTAAHRDHGRALALRDARITELRAEIAQAHELLHTAHKTASTLRVANADLAARLDAEQQRVRAAVDKLQAEIAKVVGRMGDELNQIPTQGRTGGTCAPLGGCSNGTTKWLSGPIATPLGDDLGSRTARKRRRYDSGLSLLDEDASLDE